MSTATVDRAGSGAAIGWRELALWLSGLLLVNNLVADLVAPHDAAMGVAWVLQSRFGAFDALAWAVALYLLVQTPDRQVRRGEIAGALGLCLLAGLPRHMAPPLALTGLGLALLADGRLQARAVAAIYLAIASHQFWSYLVFQLFSPELVKLDAALVGEAVSLTVKGAAWRGNVITMPNGHIIAILESCSSFSNVSASLLAWVALAKLERMRWVRADAWVATAAILTQIGLNMARLYLIAQSAPLYAYWHDGTGAQIYAMTASVAAVLIAVFGTRWAARDA